MSYDDLSKDYDRQIIDHMECYAKGLVHTNGLENFWSLLKRGLKGTYVNVEPFHLFHLWTSKRFGSTRASVFWPRQPIEQDNFPDQRTMLKLWNKPREIPIVHFHKCSASAYGHYHFDYFELEK